MVAGKVNKSKKLHTSKVVLQKKEKFSEISLYANRLNIIYNYNNWRINETI
jgi:hypothetical protein